MSQDDFMAVEIETQIAALSNGQRRLLLAYGDFEQCRSFDALAVAKQRYGAPKPIGMPALAALQNWGLVDGHVERDADGQPLRTWFHITPIGRDLLPALRKWIAEDQPA